MLALSVLGYVLAAVSVVAVLMAADVWIRVDNALPQQAWRSYALWHQEHANYLN